MLVFMNYLQHYYHKIRSDIFIYNYVIQSVSQFDTKSRETDSIS